MEKCKLFLTLTLLILINSDTNTENNFPKSDKAQEILNEEEIIHRFEPYNI